MKLVLTCEHAGNQIPDKFKYLFEGKLEVLETHRGYDPGAFDLFNYLKDLAYYHQAYMESRLLIEVNRSLSHPAIFSEFSRDIPPESKNQLIKEYYQPYRESIKKVISGLISEGDEVLHLSIHSFTPVFDGHIRKADIGLLYDPASKNEKDFSQDLKKELLVNNISLRIRFNYPYRGTADGLTTSLRKIFTTKYSGIEIEVNQKFVEKNKMNPGLKKQIYSSLRSIMVSK